MINILKYDKLRNIIVVNAQEFIINSWAFTMSLKRK